MYTLFKEYEFSQLKNFEDDFDWQMLCFFIIVLIFLVVLLYGYAKRMDKRITNEQAEKELKVRRQLTQKHFA